MRNQRYLWFIPEVAASHESITGCMTADDVMAHRYRTPGTSGDELILSCEEQLDLTRRLQPMNRRSRQRDVEIRFCVSTDLVTGKTPLTQHRAPIAPRLPDGTVDVSVWVPPNRADLSAGIIVHALRLKDVYNQWPISLHVSSHMGDEATVKELAHGRIPGVPLAITMAGMTQQERDALAAPTMQEIVAQQAPIPIDPYDGMTIFEKCERTGCHRARDDVVPSNDVRELRIPEGFYVHQGSKCIGPGINADDLRAGIIAINDEWVLIAPMHAVTNYLKVDVWPSIVTADGKDHVCIVCPASEVVTAIGQIKEIAFPSILRVKPSDMELRIQPESGDWRELTDTMKMYVDERRMLVNKGRVRDARLDMQFCGTLVFTYSWFTRNDPRRPRFMAIHQDVLRAALIEGPADSAAPRNSKRGTREAKDEMDESTDEDEDP